MSQHLNNFFFSINKYFIPGTKEEFKIMGTFYLHLIPFFSTLVGPALSVECTCLRETSQGPPRGSSPLLPWLCKDTREMLTCKHPTILNIFNFRTLMAIDKVQPHWKKQLHNNTCSLSNELFTLSVCRNTKYSGEGGRAANH